LLLGPHSPVIFKDLPCCGNIALKTKKALANMFSVTFFFKLSHVSFIIKVSWYGYYLPFKYFSTLQGKPTIQSIPIQLFFFSNLQRLILCGNQLQDIPWSVIYLRQLKELDVSFNALVRSLLKNFNPFTPKSVWLIRGFIWMVTP